MSADITQTVICNMALGHLGISKQIGNMVSERSMEANACRQFYEQIRDQVLADYRWGFATGFATLNLVATNPTSEWLYSYRYPSACLKIRRILSGIRTDSRQSRVPFKMGADATGELIYTDKENAQVEYTLDQVDPSRYTVDFNMAFSLLLAVVIAPQLTGGDPFNVGQKVQSRYDNAIGKAQANDANEEQADPETDAEWIRAAQGYDPNMWGDRCRR